MCTIGFRIKFHLSSSSSLLIIIVKLKTKKKFSWSPCCYLTCKDTIFSEETAIVSLQGHRFERSPSYYWLSAIKGYSALEWPPLAQCSCPVSWKLVKWFKIWHWRTHALHGVTFLLLKRSSKLIRQQSISMNVEGKYTSLFGVEGSQLQGPVVVPLPRVKTPSTRTPTPWSSRRLPNHYSEELSCSLGVPSNPFHFFSYGAAAQRGPWPPILEVSRLHKTTHHKR